MQNEIYLKLAYYLTSFTDEPFHVIEQNLKTGTIKIEHSLSGGIVELFFDFPLRVNDTVMTYSDILQNKKVMNNVNELIGTRIPRAVFLDYTDKKYRIIKVKVRTMTGNVLYEGILKTWSFKFSRFYKYLMKNKFLMKLVSRRFRKELKKTLKEK